jgi:maltooligosyltrehalose trehalohydrolase
VAQGFQYRRTKAGCRACHKDFGAYHFLAELADTVDRLNRETAGNHFLIGESDLNDARFITPSGKGALGWMPSGAMNFTMPCMQDLPVKGMVIILISGIPASWQMPIITPLFITENIHLTGKGFSEAGTDDIPGSRFVICTQNHDQVGNRMLGERLTSLVDFESLKLAAGAMFFSPYIPMLFMGEEYGEQAPFLYFTSHGDKDLVRR